MRFPFLSVFSENWAQDAGRRRERGAREQRLQVRSDVWMAVLLCFIIDPNPEEVKRNANLTWSYKPCKKRLAVNPHFSSNKTAVKQ